MLNQIKKVGSDNQRLGFIPGLDVILKAALRVLNIGNEFAGLIPAPSLDIADSCPHIYC